MVAGKRSGLVEDEDEDEDEDEAHPTLVTAKRACERTETSVRHGWETSLRFRRHDAAAQLETNRWPPALKKRRVVKSIVDEQYTQALCNLVAALEALLRHLLGWGQQDDRGHCDDGWMTTRRKGHEPQDACDVLIPILRGKCGRVDAAHLRQRPRNMA